jgi:rare lipoprotein A
MPDRYRLLSPAPCFVGAALALLAGCSTSPVSRPQANEARTAAASPPAASGSYPQTGPRGGAYYKDDGPGANPPPDLEATPDAVPKIEPPLRSATNRPYRVFGKEYLPDLSERPFKQRGVASWYGRKFHGQKTSSGERYDMYSMTAAHPTMPLPSYARVTNVKNGRTVIVRVNDRGPFHSNRIMDLSYTAALKLGYVAQGSAEVQVERLGAEEIARWQAPAPTAVAAAPAGPALAPPAAAAVPVVEAQAATRVAAHEALAAGPSPAPPATPAPAIAPPAAEDDPLAGIVASASASGPIASAPAPAASANETVFLQLGAFATESSALEVHDRVRRDAGWLSQGLKILPLDKLFKVHVGPFRDRSEASGVAERLRQALPVSPVIVVR